MPGAVFGTCERLLLLLLCVETQREQIFATEEPGELRSMGSMGTRLSDFTFTFSLSCIGEGNGNPLQCSCLENLRDGGAWRAAAYGVAQSRT